MSKLVLPALAALSMLALSACAPTVGMRAAMPGRPPISGMATTFDPAAFAWSRAPGRNSIAGRIAYKQGATRFTCAGAGVVLTPETPWSRQRMAVLYGSTERAALPTTEVRARTPRAPAGDAGPYVKRATCDSTDRFSFAGLPDGAWYVITLARPAGMPQADGMALMRRVVTRGGKLTAVDL